MKTASIITMHCPLNYGAVLQTYALQTYLEHSNIETKIIDYNPHYIVYDQSFFYVGNERLNKYWITRWVYRIVKFPAKLKRKRAFADFKTHELHLTRRFETYDEIACARLSADLFICGSDQIWNTTTGAHLDPAFFLEFVKNPHKRNSYAASGNLPLTTEVLLHTIPMINKLNHISIREDSTICTIQPYVYKKIKHVCDPVFLIDSDEWRALYKKKSRFKKKEAYVLAYPMGNGVENVIKKAFEVAKTNNLPIYCITDSQKKDKRVSRYYNTDPYTFLDLIDKADCVVTNSFHGTAFCIILKKTFWACNAIGANHRIESLLNLCGLQERSRCDCSKLSKMNKDDFRNASSNLSKYIQDSKIYLEEVINE